MFHYCVLRLSQTLSVYIRHLRLHEVVVSVVWICGVIPFLFFFLDLCLRRSLEKRPRICMLDSHSVLSNILSPSIVQAVRISFAIWFCSCFLSRLILNFRVNTDVFRKMNTCTPPYEEPVPWKAVKHLSLFSHSSVVETLQGKSRRWFTKFFKYDPPSIDQRTLFDFVSM